MIVNIHYSSMITFNFNKVTCDIYYHRHQRSGERLDPGGFRFGVVVSAFSLHGLYMIPFILFFVGCRGGNPFIVLHVNLAFPKDPKFQFRVQLLALMGIVFCAN